MDGLGRVICGVGAPLLTLSGWLEFSGWLEVGEEPGEEADGGQVGAELVDVDDAGGVGYFAEDGGTDASHAEGEAEEEAGDHADAAGDELLRVDEDGGEGGGQDEADDDGEDGGPQQIGVGQDEGEGQDA